MSRWLVGNPGTPSGTSMCCQNQSSQCNPYTLIYHVIKFAFNHKNPLQRSALTYWEDKLPSRIDLGKSKYGGPFTSEEVENVKTFLQLIKILMSLLGIFVVSFSINLGLYHSALLTSSNPLLLEVTFDVVNVAVVIFLYALLFLSCRKCLPKMLKRIWIGAVFITAAGLSSLLMESVYTSWHSKTKEQSSCVMTVSPYLQLIPTLLEAGAYTIFTMSLFELIIAQSPQTMKGILIGLYYTLRFGLVGLFLFAEYHALDKYRAHDYVLSCATAHYLEISVIGLLSLFMYTIIACKYKPRERDEVVNVHIFAEEYYTKS